jgi:hypothetical protein
MVGLYIGYLLLFGCIGESFAAASSSSSSSSSSQTSPVSSYSSFASIVSSSSSNSDNEETSIQIPEDQKSPVRGSRIRLIRAISALRLNLMGVTPEHVDAAGQQIENQLNQVSTQTPHSSRVVDVMRLQIAADLERRRNILVESVGQTQSSSHVSELVDSSGSSDSFENLSREELHDLLIAVQYANNVLTQTAVRAQDDRERAVYEADTNKKFGILGTVLGVGGIALSIVFGLTSFI